MKGRECRGDREGGKINIQVETMLKLKTTEEGGGIRRMMREGKGKPAVVPVCLGGPETG